MQGNHPSLDIKKSFLIAEDSFPFSLGDFNSPGFKFEPEKMPVNTSSNVTNLSLANTNTNSPIGLTDNFSFNFPNFLPANQNVPGNF